MKAGGKTDFEPTGKYLNTRDNHFKPVGKSSG